MRSPFTVRLLAEALTKRKEQEAIFVVPGHDHSYVGLTQIEPVTVIKHLDGTLSEDPGYDDAGMDECFGVGEWKRVPGMLIGR